MINPFKMASFVIGTFVGVKRVKPLADIKGLIELYKMISKL